MNKRIDDITPWERQLLLGSATDRSWYSVISLHEPDDGKALGVFCKILDNYLAELGYDPIPVGKEK